MRIHSSTRAPLHKLGIAIQPTGKTIRNTEITSPTLSRANNLADTTASDTDELRPRESFAFTGLQLVDFDQAYLVAKNQPVQKMALDPVIINESQLLGALNNLGQEIDFDRALQIQTQASSILQKIRQQTPIAADPQFMLVIEGAFGKITLDLEKLQPEQLQSAFAESLAMSPSSEIESAHSQIAHLSHKIRSQMSFPAVVDRAQNWLELVMQPGLKLPAFFEAALGYNPLESAQTIQNLLTAPPEVGGISKTPETLALERLIAERVAALVAEANALGDLLELAPQPNSPDVSALLRAFLAIFQQLDRDLNALLQPELEKKSFQRHLLAQFADNLRDSLKVTADFLNQTESRPSERLLLLVNHQRQHLAARMNLLLQATSPSERQQAFQNSQALLIA